MVIGANAQPAAYPANSRGLSYDVMHPRARFRPMSPGSRAIGLLLATIPTATSDCDRMAVSRLAKLISLASVISLPLSVSRPRMRAMETSGFHKPGDVENQLGYYLG
jgi:hypothetical protein